jgi:hypothetical protein
MKKTLLIATMMVAGLLLSTHSASAQVTTANHLAWDQSAPDLATATGYNYKYYPDGSSLGTSLDGGVVCTGTASPFQCTDLVPPFTPAAHTISITATNVAGESLKSNTITFTFVVVPSAPANLHIAGLHLKPYKGKLNLT